MIIIYIVAEFIVPILLIVLYIIDKNNFPKKATGTGVISSPLNAYNRITYMLVGYLFTLEAVSFFNILGNEHIIQMSVLSNVLSFRDFSVSYTGIAIGCFSLVSLIDVGKRTIFKIEDILSEINIRLWLEMSIVTIVAIGILSVCIPEINADLLSNNVVARETLVFGILLESMYCLNLVANTRILWLVIEFIFEKHQAINDKLYRVYPCTKQTFEQFNLDSIENTGLINGLEYYLDLYDERVKRIDKKATIEFANILKTKNKRYICLSVVFINLVYLMINAGMLGSLLLKDIRYVRLLGILFIFSLVLLNGIVLFIIKKSKRVLLMSLFDTMDGLMFKFKRTSCFRPIKSYRFLKGRYRKYVNSLVCVVVYSTLLVEKMKNDSCLCNNVRVLLKNRVEEIHANIGYYAYLPIIATTYICKNNNIDIEELDELLGQANIPSSVVELAEKIVDYRGEGLY